MTEAPKRRHRRLEQPVDVLFTEQGMVRADTIARAIGYSERQVWRLRARGLLPEPVKLKAPRGTRWRAPEVRVALARLGLLKPLDPPSSE